MTPHLGAAQYRAGNYRAAIELLATTGGGFSRSRRLPGANAFLAMALGKTGEQEAALGALRRRGFGGSRSRILDQQAQIWQELQNRLFAEAAEMLGVPVPQPVGRTRTGSFAGGFANLDPQRRRQLAALLAERYDSNADGKLSQQEAPTGLWRDGAADRNGDGQLDAEEIAAALTDLGGDRSYPQQRQESAVELIDHFDKDDDDKLSQAEAPAVLWNEGASDRNGDGQLDMEEVVAAFPGFGFRYVSAVQNIQRYDTDADGKLSQQEAPAELWNVGASDRNGDGHLDFDELAGSLRGGPGRHQSRAGPAVGRTAHRPLRQERRRQALAAGSADPALERRRARSGR